MKNTTVVHANQLIESSYGLALDEMRLIALAATKVDSRKKNVGEIRIDVSEFKKTYGITGNHVYTTLRDAVRSIMRKPISMSDGKHIRELSWLVSNEYAIKDGSHIIIEFSPKIEPYLFELKERFTSINFEYVAKLNTPYSFRIYQWLYEHRNLEKFRDNGCVKFDLSLEWIKSRLGLIDKHDDWRNFSQHVIKPSIARINKYTDLFVMWEPIKTGRSVTGIRFSYVIDEEYTDKPLRPRLFRRPKVVKGSHEEGVWMRKNLKLLLKFEADLKAYDPNEKMPLADLRKMAEYASIEAPELRERIEREIAERTTKR